MSTLAPLKYKDYTWPHNPKSYNIKYERELAVHKYPGISGEEIEDLSANHRVLSGEGEFFGEGAYKEFGKLATVFYNSGPGKLVHPIWQISNAYFRSLELTQEPRPDYIAYKFEFWEEIKQEDPKKPIVIVQSKVEPSASASSTTAVKRKCHVVIKGEWLELIAVKYSISYTEVKRLNPQIKNPNLIYPGDIIYLE